MINKMATKILLALVLILALGLRVYQLDSVPPSLNWDEVDGGYNAYAIANWARDEWGQFLPLVFTSFRDDKHPVHIYLTAPIVKLFGLSDFTTRVSGAMIGVFGVIVIFYLTRIIFKNDLTALLSALFLAISPYHIHFSRGLWEANFAPFFFMLGLLLFYLGLQKKGWFIIFAFLSFGLSLFSYHSAKIIVPPIILLLVVLNFKLLIRKGIFFYSGLIILMIFISVMLFDTRLLGLARVDQTKPSEDLIKSTSVYKLTGNDYLAMLEVSLSRYPSYFSKDYLFLSGDLSPRNSTKSFGEFYKIDALFTFVGLIYLLALRSKISLIILGWLLLSPLPATLASDTPNATRAIFMIGSMHIIAGVGASKITTWYKGKTRIFIATVILIVVGLQAYSFFNYYFNIFPKKDAIDWQYGMKQIVEFVKTHKEYDHIFMTDIRSQPYIFFLFYLKTPLPEFLNTVVYNNSKESKSFSTVSYFDKYFFGGWDPIESEPQKGRLYIISPSQYDGLKYKAAFDVKKIIYYPDGSTAFFLVSGSN